MSKHTKSQEATSQKKITFSGIMHSADFGVMYRIKIKRICKGYSQQETAFLMGKDKDYISTRERFGSKKQYTAADINTLAFILDYACHSFVPANPTKHKNNTYAGSELREDGKIYHEASIKNGVSNKLLFKVEEDDPDVVNFPASEERQLTKLKILITALCEIGYFMEDRTAFQIFFYCSRSLSSYVSPRLVELAINHFIQGKTLNKVLKDGHYIYRSTDTKRSKITNGRSTS